MKRVETISSAEEWVGVSASGELLFDGNPNSGLRYHIGGPNRALYSNSHIFPFTSKRACAEACREWNASIVKEHIAIDAKVKPMRVRFLVLVTKEVKSTKNTKNTKNNTKGRSMT